MAAVGKGKGAEMRASGGVDGEEGLQRAVQERKVRREEVAYGMRGGDLQGVVHGVQWARCAAGEKNGGQHTRAGERGCPVGCGVRCTIQHVVMGECRACDRGVRREALAGMKRALEELDDVITKDGRRRLKTRAADGEWVQEEMGEAEREGRRGEAWARQLEAARGAVDAAAAGREMSK